MTIKQVEYFLKVCELKQISECSKFFGISQSAMSISIKNLENSLGGNLFDRRGKTLIINERGKSFAKAITPIYNKVLEIEKNMKDKNMFEINIMSSQNIGNYLLPYILTNLLDSNQQNIQIKTDIANTSVILDKILNNECDLAVVEGEFRNKDLNLVKICDDELIVVTGDKTYLDRICNTNELSSKEWIMRENGSGARDTFFKNLPKSVDIKILLELTSTEAIKRCIMNKNYFACVPKISVKNELGKGIYEVKFKTLKFKRVLNVVYLKDKETSENFIKIIEKIINQLIICHENLTK
ncbi:LysR family transcriptional regulator [Campylobacter sp. FMV-PI01]|uniref:LysR family transcriptional regulator n=1 Tax=Campylobacter portucalensis TaxID=2608384 RepID=A0A6L5WFG3_9BACT|nr:LysR family transcriptional regulator [Campylobacter portucalensis]MSN95619.1 LysR family transcriptional regulator [Campylobacter portucalensis]